MCPKNTCLWDSQNSEFGLLKLQYLQHLKLQGFWDSFSLLLCIKKFIPYNPRKKQVKQFHAGKLLLKLVARTGFEPGQIEPELQKGYF